MTLPCTIIPLKKGVYTRVGLGETGLKTPPVKVEPLAISKRLPVTLTTSLNSGAAFSSNRLFGDFDELFLGAAA